jgi:hypothetical protein
MFALLPRPSRLPPPPPPLCCDDHLVVMMEVRKRVMGDGGLADGSHMQN